MMVPAFRRYIALRSPHVNEDAFQRGHAVGRELHEVDLAVAFEQRGFQQPGADHRDHDSDEVDEPHDPGLIPGNEKGRNNQRIDRQSGSAAHEGKNQDGGDAVLFRFDAPGRHDRRNGAAKAEKQGNEAFAVESEFPHESIHDKRGARHVSAVLQKRDGQKQKDDVRKKNQNSADSADDSLGQQGPEELQFPSGQTALTPSASFPNSVSIRSMNGWAQVNVNQKVSSMMRRKIGSR